jgi:hypothetical protein
MVAPKIDDIVIRSPSFRCHRQATVNGENPDVRFVRKAEVAVIRSVELIIHPDAHDVVGEMRVRGDRASKIGKSTLG